ncbi:MAG TPA: DUF3179 domain-containing protein [Candidatus Tenderia electrophaga]|uniref:DUF3179 domain-containing protein n=1 Tax=Candidatus Tenderia electrophaga TaxID=1748243 RepID=A0A832J4M5_9GAMM|nr:DUF3179 domain-containing protein [Candidatus Tenderia electrophaga]
MPQKITQSNYHVTDGLIQDRFNGKTLRIHYDKDNNSARVMDMDGKPLPGITAFWFAWMAFHPDRTVFTAAHEQ